MFAFQCYSCHTPQVCGKVFASLFLDYASISNVGFIYSNTFKWSLLLISSIFDYVGFTNIRIFQIFIRIRLFGHSYRGLSFSVFVFGSKNVKHDNKRLIGGHCRRDSTPEFLSNANGAVPCSSPPPYMLVE